MLGRIGGDTDLSPRGHFYATLLAKYFNSNKIENLRVWTSEKKRTKQTANGIKAPVESLAPLNELDAVNRIIKYLIFFAYLIYMYFVKIEN